jgi:hypothetical protein
LQYTTPVKMSKHIHTAPGLDHLRSGNQQQRKSYLMHGGIFPELWRILRSDRHSHRHFLSFFWRRRINSLRSLFKN